MPATDGRYADVVKSTRWAAGASRLRWIQARVMGGLHHSSWRRHPEDTGAALGLHREWGRWTVRPSRGWRSLRWVTPPVHATRDIAARDKDDAVIWAAHQLGLPV